MDRLERTVFGLGVLFLIGLILYVPDWTEIINNIALASAYQVGYR